MACLYEKREDLDNRHDETETELVDKCEQRHEHFLAQIITQWEDIVNSKSYN